MNKFAALDMAVSLAKTAIEQNIQFFEIGNQSSGDRFYVSFYNEHAIEILKYTALQPTLRPIAEGDSNASVYNTYYFRYETEGTETVEVDCCRNCQVTLPDHIAGCTEAEMYVTETVAASADGLVEPFSYGEKANYPNTPHEPFNAYSAGFSQFPSVVAETDENKAIIEDAKELEAELTICPDCLVPHGGHTYDCANRPNFDEIPATKEY